MAVKSSETTADWWPPGFRFHPTDEELILYWLKRKICRKRCKLDIVGEVDVYKCEPEELPGLSLLKTGDRQWFFFSPRDRKYPNGLRSNRGTKHGYWKATGKDRNITSSDRTVGIKKTLVFYKGRAPNGERTDWVMHEYTLDENELKRCENVQDYYALYKVFKKSGPGPKNGEQYGAPFREEDWADDDRPELTEHNDPTIHVKQSSASAADYCNAENQADFTWTDIEECMKRLANEPLPGDTVVNHGAIALPQVLGEEESSVSDLSFARAAYVDPQAFYPPFTQHNVEGIDNCIFSTTSQSPLDDATQIPSTDVVNLSRHVAEDDFLEMDDLLSMEPVGDMAEYLDPDPSGGRCLEPQHLNSYVQENAPWGEFDGMSEADLYHDFLHSMSRSNEAVMDDCSLMAAQVRQPANYTGFEEGTSSYGVNNREDNVAEFSGKDVSVCAAEFQRPGSATHSNPGVVCGGENFTPNAMELHENKNGSGKGVEGAENWYTSALWSFVESIPTTPASAADSALLNKALESMSSFSRLRVMNAKNAVTTAPVTSSATNNSAPSSSSPSRSGSGTSSSGTSCSHGAVVRKEPGGRMKGFFLLSFLGALFAVIFVFSRLS